MIVTPGTNLSQRTACQLLARMEGLLMKRKTGQISRKVFLVAWSLARRKLEHTPEYRQFRQEVLERDGYRCRSCGRVASIVHHRRRVARNVHLALDARNAITICGDCHSEEHPHLRRAS